VGRDTGDLAGLQRPGRELNYRIQPGGISTAGSWMATPEGKHKLIKYTGWGSYLLATNKMFPGFNKQVEA
jgi:hypothetical protein